MSERMTAVAAGLSARKSAVVQRQQLWNNPGPQRIQRQRAWWVSSSRNRCCLVRMLRTRAKASWPKRPQPP